MAVNINGSFLRKRELSHLLSMYPWNPVLLFLKSFRVCNLCEVILAEGRGGGEIVYGTKIQKNKQTHKKSQIH